MRRARNDPRSVNIRQTLDCGPQRSRLIPGVLSVFSLATVLAWVSHGATATNWETEFKKFFERPPIIKSLVALYGDDMYFEWRYQPTAFYIRTATSLSNLALPYLPPGSDAAGFYENYCWRLNQHRTFVREYLGDASLRA